MENYPHKKFLEENKEQIEKMPVPRELQKRLIGFDEIQEDLQHTIGEDRVKMEENLWVLSHELLEDLEEQYEHHLENNEFTEEEPNHELEPAQPEVSEKQNAPEQVVQEEEPEFRMEMDRQPDEAHVETETEPEPLQEKEKEPENNETHSDEEEENHQEEMQENIQEETQENHQEQTQEEPLIEEAVQEEYSSQPHKEPSDEEILSELHNDKKLQVHPSDLKAMGFKGHLHSRTIGVGKFYLRRGKYETCYTIFLRTN